MNRYNNNTIEKLTALNILDILSLNSSPPVDCCVVLILKSDYSSSESLSDNER